MAADQQDKRVLVIEAKNLNPYKGFVFSFNISEARRFAQHTVPSSWKTEAERAKGRIGPRAMELVNRILAISGVDRVKVSQRQLVVYKSAPFKWREILPNIQDLLSSHFKGLKIKRESSIVLLVKRLKAILSV